MRHHSGSIAVTVQRQSVSPMNAWPHQCLVLSSSRGNSSQHRFTCTHSYMSCMHITLVVCNFARISKSPMHLPWSSFTRAHICMRITRVRHIGKPNGLPPRVVDIAVVPLFSLLLLLLMMPNDTFKVSTASQERAPPCCYLHPCLISLSFIARRTSCAMSAKYVETAPTFSCHCRFYRCVLGHETFIL